MVDNECVPHLLSVKDAQYRQKFIDLVVLMLMEGICMYVHVCITIYTCQINLKAM